MKRIPSITAVAGLGLASATLAAQPQLISQTRYVRASGTEMVAVGFGLFDESVSYADDPQGFPCIPSSNSASQESEITTAGFFANGGSNESIGTCRLPGDERGFGPPNLFEFEFAVTAETTLALSGTLRTGITGFDPPGMSSGSAVVSLEGAAGIIGTWRTGGIDELVVTIDEEILLAPGEYTFSTRASADPVPQDSGFASYDIAGTFEPASCPADLNDDDVLDLADLELFVTAFLGTDPPADIDGNGIYDLADVQGFIAAFNAGCP